MDPKDAISKIETEMAQTCGAMSALILSNTAKKVGVEKTAIGSKEEYQKLVDALAEPAAKFLGKTKAEEYVKRWKTLV